MVKISHCKKELHRTVYLFLIIHSALPAEPFEVFIFRGDAREFGFIIEKCWAMEGLGGKGRMELILAFFHLVEAQRHIVIKEILALENEVCEHLVEELGLFCECSSIERED